MDEKEIKEMPEESLNHIRDKASKGLFFMVIRQVLIQVVGLVGNILLARILTPEDFGVIAIATFIVGFVATYVNVGFGAALLRRQNDPTDSELKTLATVQSATALLICLLIWFGSPFVLHFYASLHQEHLWIIRAVGINFLISSLRTSPAIRLEKRLEFNKIALVEVVENTVYYLVAVVLVFLGYGLWSIILAITVRSIAGTGLLILLTKKIIQFGFDKNAFKELAKYGFAFQFNSVLFATKNMVSPILVGGFIGTTALGYVSWAQQSVERLLVLTRIYDRIAFPTIAKFGHNPELLGRAIGKSMRMLSFIMFPIATLQLALAPHIIHFIFTDKWLPALGCFYLFSFTIINACFAIPLFNAIAVISSARDLYKFSIGYLILEWGIGIIAITLYGFIGAAASIIPISLAGNWWYISTLKQKGVQFSTLKLVMPFIITNSIVFIFTFLYAEYFINANEVASFILAVLFGILIAIVCNVLFNRNVLNEFLIEIFRSIGFNKKIPWIDKALSN